MSGTQPNTDVLGWHLVRRYVSTLLAFLDGAQAPVRAGNCGAAYVQKVTEKSHKQTDEGSYFLVRSPTPGTGLVTTMILNAGLDDAKPFIVIQNNNPPGGKTIHLDYIKLRLTIVGS